MNCCKRILVTVFPALYATSAFAGSSGDAIGAESLAMGSTAAAALDDNSAITVNPAAIGLVERYDFHGRFAYGPSAGLHWGANVVDSRTSKDLAAGLSYSGDRFEGPLVPGETPGWRIPGQALDNTKRNHDFTAALAFPLFDRRLSLGVNGNLSLYHHDRYGQGKTFNADVGLAARPFDWLAVGVAAQNVLPIEGLGDRPFGAIGGVRLHDPTIGAVEVDVGWTDLQAADPWSSRAWTWAVGAAKTFGRVTTVRAGFRRDGPFDRRDVTFGVGLGGGGARLSWGVAVPVGAGADTLSGMVNQLSITFDAPDPHSIEAPF